MLMYLTFSNMNSNRWLIKNNDIGLNVLFSTFHDKFQVKLFPPKIWIEFKFENVKYTSIYSTNI
jgi:hypothetical protein